MQDLDILLFGIIVLCVGLIFGDYIRGQVWRNAAITHNAGKYVITDLAKGTTTFKWNDEIK